jgi:hypothetical protein
MLVAGLLLLASPGAAGILDFPADNLPAHSRKIKTAIDRHQISTIIKKIRIFHLSPHQNPESVNENEPQFHGVTL